ncbi:MAG: helix-turn-helix transcriptional regulator [Pseudomonadota bacterium]|nr:helix-turn-helix transcriptional regulator [Pseudomonadota bacterium]
MIRFRLKELLAEREFQERRVVTLNEVAAATGIHRATLSKISNEPGYNTGTDNLDRLCGYFGCPIDKLVEYIPNEKTDRTT